MIEVWSVSGWKPLSQWVYLTPKGYESALKLGWPLAYTFRWRRV